MKEWSILCGKRGANGDDEALITSAFQFQLREHHAARYSRLTGTRAPISRSEVSLERRLPSLIKRDRHQRLTIRDTFGS